MQQYPYWQQPQTPYQLYKPIKKNKTAKTLAIVCQCVFFACVYLIGGLHAGLVFGFIALVALVTGFICLCCI